MHARSLLVVLAVAACGRGSVVVLGEGGGEGGASVGGAAGQVVATSAGGGAVSSTTGAGGTTSTSSGQGGGVEICDGFDVPCNECIADACPEVWCACVGDPECFDLFQCFGDCQMDEACQQDCLALHQDSISTVVQVSGCAGTTCSNTCAWGNPDYDECSECIYDSCAPEMNVCLANPECGDLFACFGQCPELDLTCQQTCYDTFPGGVSDLQTALMCINGGCQMVCGE